MGDILQSSRNTTPSSSHRSSDSSHDSDTTPSPSGCHVPEFSPQELCSKLALYEASQSLSAAADSFAAAAQAMSKAAKSLALAGGYSSARSAYKTAMPFEDFSEPKPACRSPIQWKDDWQQTSYALPSSNMIPDNRVKHEKLPGLTESNRPLELGISSCSAVDPGGSSMLHGLYDGQTPSSDTIGPILHVKIGEGEQASAPGAIPVPATSVPQVGSDVTLSPVEVGLSTLNNIASCIDGTKLRGMQTSCNNGNKEDLSQINTSEPQIENQFDNVTSACSSFDGTLLPNDPNTVAPCSVTETGSSGLANNSFTQRKSSIVLERGVDELPAVVFLCRQYEGKTICLYKYRDASDAYMSTISSLAGGYVVPGGRASAPAARAKSFKNFLNGNHAILLWPGDLEIPQNTTAIPTSKIRLIHIEELSQRNNAAECAMSFVVTSAQAMSNLGLNQKVDLLREYPINTLSQSCNIQGKGSPIEQLRQKMRIRLRKPMTDVFYKAFISHNYAHHPEWTAQELARHANEYAHQYLLRGNSTDCGEVIGGPIALTQTEVEKWNLGAAVEAGTLINVAH